RVAMPLLFAGLALAATLLLLDDTYLPYFNQRQDALHNQIKGRPPQTYAHPQRWIFGENSKIYNYDVFDQENNLFGGLSVLELDPSDFHLRVGELSSYIEGLHRAGFNVATLMVQWHKKMAYPLMAPVSMLLAIPFAFLVGTRGALGGVALGVGIAVAYWAIAKLLDAMG